LPLVERMRLTDVHGLKIDAVPVALMHLLQPVDRPAEGRSREAAEDEDLRPAGIRPEQRHLRAAVERGQHPRGREVADLQVALAALVVADHPDDVARADLHHHHRRGEHDNAHDRQENLFQHRICAYHKPMESMPVMLAPPPRRVPLSLSLLNVFNGFAQIGWFVFGFGMIFAWVFLGNADFSFLTFRGPHAQSTGRVTSVEATGASQNEQPITANHYEFSVAGSRFSGTSYSNGSPNNAGDEVTVEYDEQHPERSRIAGMRRGQFSAGVMLVLIFPFIGAVFVAFATLAGFRRNHLLRNGLLSTGKLLGRERTNVTVNKRPVWKLTFEYVARDGQRHEATASTTDTTRLEDE